MKTIEIAGVSVNTDVIDTIDYDTIMSMALTSKKYYLKPNAKRDIAAELKKHGILKANTKPIKKDINSKGSRRTNNKAQKRGN